MSESSNKEWYECMEVITASIHVDANDTSNQSDIYCGCKPKSSDGLCCTTRSCPNRKTLTECTECHPNCENQCLQKTQHAELDVKDIGGKGFGLFALQDLRKGQFVTEYVGELISEKELIRRLSSTVDERHLYMMQLKSNTFLDARYKGSKSRHINHSCDPNCTVEVWSVKRRYRVGIFTTKDISANEELTFDYQWQPSARKPTKCLCNTPKCRGYLEVFESEEQKKAFLEEDEEEEYSKNARTGRWIAKKEACSVLYKSIMSQSTSESDSLDGGPNSDTQLDVNSSMGDIKRKICEKLVGCRLKMWWEGNMAYFEVDVMSYDAKNGCHRLLYIGDKTEEVVNLMKGCDYSLLDSNGSTGNHSPATVCPSVNDGGAVDRHDWMFLDETAEEVAIKKKSRLSTMFGGHDDTKITEQYAHLRQLVPISREDCSNSVDDSTRGNQSATSAQTSTPTKIYNSHHVSLVYPVSILNCIYYYGGVEAAGLDLAPLSWDSFYSAIMPYCTRTANNNKIIAHWYSGFDTSGLHGTPCSAIPSGLTPTLLFRTLIEKLGKALFDMNKSFIKVSHSSKNVNEATLSNGKYSVKELYSMFDKNISCFSITLSGPSESELKNLVSKLDALTQLHMEKYRIMKSERLALEIALRNSGITVNWQMKPKVGLVVVDKISGKRVDANIVNGSANLSGDTRYALKLVSLEVNGDSSIAPGNDKIQSKSKNSKFHFDGDVRAGVEFFLPIKTVKQLSWKLCAAIVSLAESALIRSQFVSVTLQHSLSILHRFLTFENEDVSANSTAILVACIILPLKVRGDFKAKYLATIIRTVYTKVFGQPPSDRVEVTGSRGYIGKVISAEAMILHTLQYDVYVFNMNALISSYFANNARGDKCLSYTALSPGEVECNIIDGNTLCSVLCYAFPMEWHALPMNVATTAAHIASELIKTEEIRDRLKLSQRVEEGDNELGSSLLGTYEPLSSSEVPPPSVYFNLLLDIILDPSMLKLDLVEVVEAVFTFLELLIHCTANSNTTLDADVLRETALSGDIEWLLQLVSVQKVHYHKANKQSKQLTSKKIGGDSVVVETRVSMSKMLHSLFDSSIKPTNMEMLTITKSREKEKAKRLRTQLDWYCVQKHCIDVLVGWFETIGFDDIIQTICQHKLAASATVESRRALRPHPRMRFGFDPAESVVDSEELSISDAQQALKTNHSSCVLVEQCCSAGAGAEAASPLQVPNPAQNLKIDLPNSALAPCQPDTAGPVKPSDSCIISCQQWVYINCAYLHDKQAQSRAVDASRIDANTNQRFSLKRLPNTKLLQKELRKLGDVSGVGAMSICNEHYGFSIAALEELNLIQTLHYTSHATEDERFVIPLALYRKKSAGTGAMKKGEGSGGMDTTIHVNAASVFGGDAQVFPTPFSFIQPLPPSAECSWDTYIIHSPNYMTLPKYINMLHAKYADLSKEGAPNGTDLKSVITRILRQLCIEIVGVVEHCVGRGFYFKFINVLENTFVNHRGHLVFGAFGGIQPASATSSPILFASCIAPVVTNFECVLKANRKEHGDAQDKGHRESVLQVNAAHDFVNKLLTFHTSSVECLLGADAGLESSVFTCGCLCVYILTGEHLLFPSEQMRGLHGSRGGHAASEGGSHSMSSPMDPTPSSVIHTPSSSGKKRPRPPSAATTNKEALKAIINVLGAPVAMGYPLPILKSLPYYELFKGVVADKIEDANIATNVDTGSAPIADMLREYPTIHYQHIPNELIGFLCRMLHINPSQRSIAVLQDIKKSDWFKCDIPSAQYELKCAEVHSKLCPNPTLQNVNADNVVGSMTTPTLKHPDTSASRISSSVSKWGPPPPFT